MRKSIYSPNMAQVLKKAKKGGCVSKRKLPKKAKGGGCGCGKK